MAQRVELRYVGFALPTGEVLLASGEIVPVAWRAMADSETVIEGTLSKGDFVANADFTVAGIVTSTGYVKLKDDANPNDVGIHKNANASQIVAAGFNRITAQEFSDSLKPNKT